MYLRKLFLNFTLIVFFGFNTQLLYSDSNIPRFGTLPEINGIDHNGNEFKSEIHLKDKVSLINFFFTSCDGPCPTLMLRINKIISKSDCTELKVVSITVDPDTDTVEKLENYKNKIAPDNDEWIIIRMEEDQLEDLLTNQFKLGSGESLVDHTTRIVLSDSEKNIRGFIRGMDEDTIDNILSKLNIICDS